MKHRYFYFSIALTLLMLADLPCGLWRLTCHAEETMHNHKTTTPQAPQNHDEIPGIPKLDKPGERSPFQPSDLMQEYAAWGAPLAENGADWYMQNIPKITVRGFIETEKMPPTALIDIDGEGVHFVKKGDKISLQKSGNTLTLFVQEINPSEVLIKIMPFDRILSIR